MKHSVKSAFYRLAHRLIPTTAMSVALALAAGLSSCHDEPDFDNSPQGNIEALAHIIDTRYCFLDEKDLDWHEISARYAAMATPGMNEPQLFDLCAEMLDHLRDGHVNLSSRFNVSYYRKWWSDYPQNFNLRTLEQYYLDFSWATAAGCQYKVLEGNVGYIYYPSFSATVSENGLDYILAALWKTDALIIDIRDNGGGMLTNVNTLVGRFIHRKFTGGYIRHKTGPGHSDFSRPYPLEYDPAPESRLHWDKPVYLLTNRSSFSAANQFAAVMKQLPQVTVVGARTGGGGGLPFTSELPNGWAIRFSASPVTDAEGNSIEGGIDPTPGFECNGTADQFAAGTDPILDLALSHARRPQPDSDPD